MWNALRKKVNKSSRSYQLSDSHNQSDSEDSDGGGRAASTTVVLKRFAKIPSYSEGLADTTASSVERSVASRYENPYASLDARTVTAPAKLVGCSTDADRWPTVDNARYLPPSNDTSHDATDLRNNNRTDDDVIKSDDVIATGENPDGNANHVATPTGSRVSPPRLRRREKTSSLIVQRRPTGDDLSSANCQGHVVVPESSFCHVTADDDESGYSTLRDILGQVERAMLEQQQQLLQTLTVTEDHADSDLDTSGDCRDIDLEQAGRSKSTDDCQPPTAAHVPDHPSLRACEDQFIDRCEEFNNKQQKFNEQEAEQCGLVDVNLNGAEIVTETSDVVQSTGELLDRLITTLDRVTHDYDVPRSTPVRSLRDQDDEKCHEVRKAPPPPLHDDNTDDASSTPLDGTPRSQASCSTLTQQHCEPQTADESASSSVTDDNLLRVELSGDMLTVSEPTHMSWEEVLQSAHVLGIPLHPQRQPPAVMTRSDSAAVRRSSTSSSDPSDDLPLPHPIALSSPVQ